LKFPVCLNTRAISPNQSNDGSEDDMGTTCMSVPSIRPFVEVANGEISFFDRKRLEPKEWLWQQQ